MYPKKPPRLYKRKKWIALLVISTLFVIGLCWYLVDKYIWPKEELMKTRSTYYTAEKVKNARSNVTLYPWAKAQRDRAIQLADTYVDLGLDRLWESITTQKLPRSVGVNDPQVKQKSYEIDLISNPWKLRDKESGYLFPTNDFEAYYRSGLNERYEFEPKLADRKLLVNTLYPELGPTFGVDDGYGWKDKQGNTFTYIAYYNAMGLWEQLIIPALKSLRDAYVLTGDMKYAAAGIVLLNRIADVYPDMDVSVYPLEDGFDNAHGGRGTGKVFGSIEEISLVQVLLTSYDAFFPALQSDRSPAITFLQGKQSQLHKSSTSLTALDVRLHIEKNIVKSIYPAVKKSQIIGNFGMFESTLALAAIVQDTMPETKEWIDFIFQPGGEIHNNGKWEVTGGGLTSVLLEDVDRDGYGDESSPEYNVTWLENLQNLANILDGYDRYAVRDLYQNPKFRKMNNTFIDLIIQNQFTPQIGDSGTTGTAKIFLWPETILQAYVKYKDTRLAQILYAMNGKSAKGIHQDIFQKNPEKIGKEIENKAKLAGTLNLKSTLLAGYGFAALRLDRSVTSSNTSLWMYFGRNATAHSHLDTLNIGIHAYGIDLSPDFGYVTQTGVNDLRDFWESNTISHNTVVVDGKGQARNSWVGTPQHYNATKKVKLIDVTAPRVYPNTQMYRRTSALISTDEDMPYVVDFFRVDGGAEHVFSFHGMDGEVLTDQLQLTKQQKGTYAGPTIPVGDTTYNRKSSSGYNYLYGVERDSKPPRHFAVEWVSSQGENAPRLRLTMLGPLQEAALAKGDPPQNKPGNPKQLSFLLAKRVGDNLKSNFSSILEPYTQNPAIQSIEEAAVTREGKKVSEFEARAIKVTKQNGKIDYIVSAIREDQSYEIDQLLLFKGSFGVVTLDHDAISYSYVHDGSYFGSIKGAANFLKRPAAYEGTVVSFSQELTDQNEVTLQLSNMPANLTDLIGTTLVIDNDYSKQTEYSHARNAVYMIQGIKRVKGHEITMDLGDVTLIRGLTDRSKLNSSYEYNIQAHDPFRIPITWQSK
ncbi:heparinase II/III domain-containing protein [Paenibacillus sp. KN14-4R]|uniref:heparinase II/III domain-containing protein n=1 Tax=Paenibacillus sp. KN14-4R TaxID=3445773 RepID=UPI003F9FABB3